MHLHDLLCMGMFPLYMVACICDASAGSSAVTNIYHHCPLFLVFCP